MQRKLRINLRVSEDEMKVLSRSAKRAGLSLSAYLRQVGCSQPIKKKPGKALKDCFQMVGELRQNFRRASAASMDRALADPVREEPAAVRDRSALDNYLKAMEKLKGN